jgi:hypothetical protein
LGLFVKRHDAGACLLHRGNDRRRQMRTTNRLCALVSRPIPVSA